TPGWVPVLPTDEQLAEARRLTDGHFDEAFYRAQGPDLTPAGGDALLHFLVWGWRQGLNPSPAFDVAFYRKNYPDIAATDFNPLMHYLWFGMRNGLLPRSSTNPWRSQLDQARSGGARAADAAPAEVPEPVGAGALTAALGRSAAAHGLALVLSHDDHTRTAGGVQNAVGDEEAGFRAAGWGHLHVRPLRTVPVLADAVPQDEAIVQLRLDGRPLGAARVSDLVAAVGAMRMRGHAVRIVVHHFAGHAPEHVQALALAAGTAPPVVWVHDFFTLCTSYALMRNDVAFCNAPPADSPACAICCYGPERAEHVARLQRFFAGTLPVVLAPSESALEVWRRMGFDHARSAVVPLARLRLDDPGPRPWRAPGAPARPIRVAHLGTRSFLKGWAVFDALATRYGGGHGGGEAGGGRYAFYQFGLPHGLPPSGAVHAVPVQVHANDREAMARAVAEHEIDVVVIWSLCQETFCFTVHEALAGGAFVVARAEAGNVWPAVLANAPDQGCAVRSEADLVALFDGDALPDLLARPRAGGRLDFGQGTVDWFRAQEDLRG
ncbi:hypothetical protein, partial [Azospirillum sp.]|uniref:hypothetical protein n=1 Tax=Azospirillum sp. TaxID=34012 RepID=UPI002D706946|nr:hypothetical protein [Azospirillum sp.]